jgi:NADPH-dependent 2,4-dienoyl-CoA reductase/sulfur reductase-like enzyme
MSREQILEACQELLEEGKSVTVRAVVDKVGGSSRDVSPVVKEFKDNLEKESKEAMVAVTREADVEVSTANGGQDDLRDVEPVEVNFINFCLDRAASR